MSGVVVLGRRKVNKNLLNKGKRPLRVEEGAKGAEVEVGNVGNVGLPLQHWHIVNTSIGIILPKLCPVPAIWLLATPPEFMYSTAVSRTKTHPMTKLNHRSI